MLSNSSALMWWVSPGHQTTSLTKSGNDSNSVVSPSVQFQYHHNRLTKPTNGYTILSTPHTFTMNFLDLVKTTVTNIPSAVRWTSVGVVGTLVLVTGGSMARSAYVYETTCRGYETQVSENLHETAEYGEEALKIAKVANANPYAAFGLMSKMMDIVGNMELVKAETEEVRSEYVEFCGRERSERFFESDHISSELEELESIGDQLRRL